jgi:hypothetical protein
MNKDIDYLVVILFNIYTIYSRKIDVSGSKVLFTLRSKMLTSLTWLTWLQNLHALNECS